MWASDNEHVLTGDRLGARLRVDPRGAVIQLEDSSTGQTLLPFAPFFQPPQNLDLGSLEATLDIGGGLNIRWTDGGAEVVAEGNVDVAGASLRWWLRSSRESAVGLDHFPFLAPVLSGAESPLGGVLAGRFRDGRARPIVQNADWPLPIVRTDPSGQTMTVLLGINSDVPSDAVAMELVVHDGGWTAAFDLYRQRIRTQFDLSLYQRPDESWYQSQLVQHFTFLYGREILDLEEGSFDLDRFLDEGERDFGGYDGMLAWGVYPRIGIDERTQWDFYDDLPGGRAGLRDLAHRARERGVRFFVPFKPWDVASEIRGEPSGPPHEALAELVADVEADGVFLDTMSAIGREFRDAIDRERQGVVLCSEGRAKGAAFETITGSWDQPRPPGAVQGNWSAPVETLPSVDLWRFIFPEHPLFVVNRNAVGDDRIRMIQRGFFGGMGWVVWQDIFGLALPYSPEEAALLKRCRTIHREHLTVLRGPRPTPLVDTLVPGVFANEFVGETKRLWTFYNETNESVLGPVLQVRPTDGSHFVDVWTNQEVALDNQGRFPLRIKPSSISAVVEVPQSLSYDPASGQLAVRGAPPGAAVEVSSGEVNTTLALDGNALDVRSVADRASSGVARMLLNGELIDQITISPSEG